MVYVALILISTCFLAYSNGANDNFKGVATLFGSDTTDYKGALRWATLTTFAGSVSSIFLAKTLIKQFSGKGVVPEVIASSPEFLISIALAAGTTVILATFLGFPISTTHSLIGALVGTGVVAVGSQINVTVLGTRFFLPLLVSPLIAVFLSSTLYVAFRCLRLHFGITKEMCFCVGNKEQVVAVQQPVGALNLRCLTRPDISVDTPENCTVRYKGRVMGVSAQKMLDSLHFISAGMVSFARGLNDTPKIVALLLILNTFDSRFGMLIIGIAMAVGGLVNARKVAQKMSKEITPMNHGQGFTANLVTSFLVIFASRLGMPVSTTHVSVGSLFGLTLVTRKGNSSVIHKILLSWVLTLPIAALLGASIFWTLNMF